jgi:hypothetical protein
MKQGTSKQEKKGDGGKLSREQREQANEKEIKIIIYNNSSLSRGPYLLGSRKFGQVPTILCARYYTVTSW